MSKPIWSWRQAIEETDIKAATKALAYTIANDLTDTGKYSQMPIEELARRAGMNVRSAETHLAKLKDVKLLDVKIRRDAMGHPVGRKFSPMFPDSFTLPKEAAQTANFADGENEAESKLQKTATQTANFDSQTANFAGIYKETSSQTLPKTFPTTAEQAPPRANHPSKSNGGQQATLFEKTGPTKRQANKVADEESGYGPWASAYRDTIRAAGRDCGVAGLWEGRKVWAILNDAERDDRWAALPGLKKHLKANPFKTPQKIENFLQKGWEDFPPEETKAAEGPASFHPVKLEAALEYARKPHERGISATTRAIFASITQIPRDLWEHAQKIVQIEALAAA